MLSTVLILVTLGHADAPHVAFSTTPDMPACEGKATALTGVLTGAGYRIAARRCIQTDLAFARYDHGATEFPVSYRLTLPADAAQGATIEPLAALADCTANPDGDPAVWCAVSAQPVVPR